MRDSHWRDVGALAGALAADAALVQERLDRAHEEALESFAAVLAKAPEAARPWLLPLAPARLVVQRHEVTCEVQLATRRAQGLQILVKPISLGASLARERAESTRMSLRVEVQAVPRPLSPRLP